MRKAYFETEHVCIWHDLTNELGGAIWNGLLPSQKYREAFLKCAQLLSEKNLKNWIGDNRKMSAMSQEDQEWTYMMAPSIMATGLQKMATIVSEDVFHHMAVINLFDRASTQITFQNQYFRNETDAIKWLETEVPATMETASVPV